MKITPNQVRFFFNASITRPGEEPQPPLLDKLLQCQLPPGFRYRVVALRRQLESAMKPVEAKIKDLYDAYRESAKGPAGAENAAGADDDGAIESAGDDNGPEDEAAKAEALDKLNADIEAIMEKPIEFDGKLILASQLDELDGAEVRALLDNPAVMDQWLFPFIEDDQTPTKPTTKK